MLRNGKRKIIETNSEKVININECQVSLLNKIKGQNKSFLNQFMLNHITFISKFLCCCCIMRDITSGSKGIHSQITNDIVIPSNNYQALPCLQSASNYCIHCHKSLNSKIPSHSRDNHVTPPFKGDVV